MNSVPRPHPTRCDPTGSNYGSIIRAHEDASLRGDLGYYDPVSGLMVLCAATHLERGTCCGNGCRHCPFIGD